MDRALAALLASAEPAIRWKARAEVLGEAPASAPLRRLAQEIRRSEAARGLLARRMPDGRIVTHPGRGQTNPYQKWQGPHWTLVGLAEIGYPAGDRSLVPIREQVHDWLLSERHLRPPRTRVLPGQEDRVRRCASQEGNAAWAALRLGLADARTEVLLERLRAWQWPDGGWNCDPRPAARISSYHETFAPLRALALHARTAKDPRSGRAAARAAEALLRRRLFLGLRSGRPIHPRFTRLQYPHWAHYNILAALKVLAEAGFVRDPRCAEALDLLESKRLPDGGFPLELRHWVRAKDVAVSRGTGVDWGPAGRTRMNPYVTADALHVLAAAGRFRPSSSATRA